MKILKFTGQLSDIMGEDASKNWSKECGLKFHSGHQNVEEGITLMEVTDETKASKYFALDGVEVLNETEANATIVTKMDKSQYKVTSETLMGANINESAKDTTKLDLDEMLPEWTEQEELDFLYKKGISGLKKTNVFAEKFLEADLTPEELLEMIDIFPTWDSLIGRLIQIGTKFKYDGNLYRVEQENTFQTDWLPDAVPALYTKIVPDNVIPIWVQPIGATDAYSSGDKVTYNDEVWESIWEGENVNTAVPDGDIPYNRYWIPVV